MRPYHAFVFLVLAAACHGSEHIRHSPEVKGSAFSVNQSIDYDFSDAGTVTGVVAASYHTDDCSWLYLTSPNAVLGITDHGCALKGISFGDILQVCAKPSERYDKFVKLSILDISRIGHTNHVETIAVNGSAISSGMSFGRCVSTRGIISSAWHDAASIDGWNWITLWTPEGPVYAICHNSIYPLSKLHQLQGAETILCGLAFSMSEMGNPMTHFLQLYSESGITVITPPPEDPFAGKRQDTDQPCRQQLSGRVLATSANTVLISGMPSSWLILPLPGQSLPKPGQYVTAIGYLTPFSRNTILTDARLRIDNAFCSPAQPARTIDAGKLFDGDTIHFDYRQTPVTIKGRLSEAPVRIGNSTFVRLSYAGHIIDVDISIWLNEIKDMLSPGNTVGISGYIVPIYGNGIEHPLASIERLLFLPRSKDDICVLARPSWWTPGRLVALLFAVLAVLVASIAWNLALKALSERRARTLYRERLAHVHTELKVQERTHLAVEIHDSLSQTLTGVALQIDAAIKANDMHREQATAHLSAARQLLASCRHELRCCIWDLRNCTFAEANLTEAIRRMLAAHTENTKLSVRFNVPRLKLSESLMHAVLRIVYELVANAIRHGKASQVRIAGEYRNGIIRFSVSDNGCGFDPNDHPGPLQGHFGLQGIQERLKRLNGEISIKSAIGQHTKMTVAIPAHQERSSSRKDCII